MPDAARLSGAFHDRMEHADADSVPKKQFLGEPFEGKVQHAASPFDRAFPGKGDWIVLVMGHKMQRERIRALFNLLNLQAGFDSIPILVAHRAVYRSNYLDPRCLDAAQETGAGLEKAAKFPRLQGDDLRGAFVWHVWEELEGFFVNFTGPKVDNTRSVHQKTGRGGGQFIFPDLGTDSGYAAGCRGRSYRGPSEIDGAWHNRLYNALQTHRSGHDD
jgi:hypothetical protein